MIDSLTWLMVWMRPDLVEKTSWLGQFAHNLMPKHHSSVCIVFVYLVRTKEMGLYFGGDSFDNLEVHSLHFHGYLDVAYANHLMDRKSTSGYQFKLVNGPISWKNIK